MDTNVLFQDFDSSLFHNRRNPSRKSRPEFKSPERPPNNPDGKGGRSKRSTKKSTLKKERQQRAEALKSPEVIEKRAKSHRNKTTRNKYRDKLRKNPRRRELFGDDSVSVTYKKPPKKKKIHVLSQEHVSDKFDPGIDIHWFRAFCLFLTIDQESLTLITAWVYEWSHPTGKENMTAASFLDYIFEEFGVELSIEQSRLLLHELGYSWKKLKIGYYMKKAKEPWVVSHRLEVVQLLTYFINHHDLFVVFYQDESPFRKNIYQNFAWCSDSIPEHQYDARQKPGQGPGWNVCTFLLNDKKNPILIGDDGEPIGYVRDSVKGSKSGKEDAPLFLKIMEEAMVEMKKQHPGRVPVIVVDGAGTHRTMEEGAWNPAKMNLTKETEARPVTLEMKLKQLNLWNDGKSKTRKKATVLKQKERSNKQRKKKKRSSKKQAKKKVARNGEATTGMTLKRSSRRRKRKIDPAYDYEDFNNGNASESESGEGFDADYDVKNDNDDVSEQDDQDMENESSEQHIPIPTSDYKKMSVKEARDILFGTREFIDQRMAVEALAEKYNVIVLFLPCASPVLNPIERLWRLIKNEVRRKNGVSKAELHDIILHYIAELFWVGDHLENMFKLSENYMKYFHMLDTGLLEDESLAKYNLSRPVAPSERVMYKLEKKGILSEIPTIDVRRALGDPKSLEDIDFGKIYDFVHRMNIKRVTRKLSH